MNCEEIKQLLMTDYIDGEINKELKEEVEKHLDLCDDCRQLKQNLQGISGDLFKKIEQTKVSDLVWARIENSVSKEKKQSKGILAGLMNYLQPDFFIRKPVFSTTLILAGVFLAIIFTKGSFNNRKTANSYLKEQVEVFVYLDADGTEFLETENIDFGTGIEEYFL
ncbi:zf-HC2 domain-containing protein [bacterium]|nr:zf-HC2 domain-containing protein [bacterium]